MQENNIYKLNNTDDIITPQLIYYIDIVKRNTQHIIDISGGADRLWPHVKTHKCLKMVQLLESYGINKFKAATIAEAEMLANAGAGKVILAYPLVGPNIKRFISLAKAHPSVKFYAIDDDAGQCAILARNCREESYKMPLLIDVNMGMNRTGVEINRLAESYIRASQIEGISVEGLHCYDGNHHENDFEKRCQAVRETDELVQRVIKEITAKGYRCDTIVAGGTPSYPCHLKYTDWYVSPGTSFIHDYGYQENFPDLGCVPGAIVLTRVISHPARGMFTLDLGYKAIAADPTVQRGKLVGWPDAEQVLQNEEHWVFRMKNGADVPPIGTCLYVIPTHICPTSALYPEILIAQSGEIVDKWEVTARNRKITF